MRQGVKRMGKQKKSRMYIGSGQRSLRKTSIMILIPIGIALIGLIFFIGYGLQENRILANQYISDTAGLYVEQINRDISQINNELIFYLEYDENIKALPQEMNSKEGKYYPMLNALREQNRILRFRYEEVSTFYVYGQEADVLVLEAGTIFTHSNKTALQTTVTNYLNTAAAEDSISTQWMLIQSEDHYYIMSWYAKQKKAMGCIIDVDTIFSLIKERISNYETVPYLIESGGRVLVAEGTKEEEFQAVRLSIQEDSSLSYPLGSLGMINLYILPGQGILEKLLNIQMIFIVVIVVMIGIACAVGYSYYRSIMYPMEQFVKSLEDISEDKMLHENGVNKLVELESASDKFRELLRKIQTLKIAIYEKELEEQRAELEYMQEQIRPHFYLNCLSLIHGIADTKGVKEIVRITEVLSEYMRHIFRESGKQRSVGEELKQVNAYVQLQKLRYGEDAFKYDQTLDGDVQGKMLPPMLIQTLVENAIVHGVTLDRPIEISVYLTEERYENGNFLYLSVSDTGGGFAKAALEALEKDKPIFYNGRYHVGLKNLRRRLELIYGDKASISFMNMDENFGAVIEVRIPASDSHSAEERYGTKNM